MFIIIEIDISQADRDGRGPIQFIKSIANILPYKNKGCLFIPSKSIRPINSKNKSNYFYKSYPYFPESIYKEWIISNRSNNLILGPNFIPSKWNYFPNKRLWKEREIRKILINIKGIVVHSKRVRNHLATRSNTIDLSKKFIIVRACTNAKQKYIRPFKNRKIDILYFEKYPDSNRMNQASQLLSYFNNTNLSIEKLKYGRYSRIHMMKLSNQVKFIIYFSFFDTGAIGLKEIQNQGVFSFTLQKDLAIHNYTCMFVDELNNEFDMEPAFKIIYGKIKELYNKPPNSKLIAKINQNINGCERALDDLCTGIS